jgi:hypothetical protein
MTNQSFSIGRLPGKKNGEDRHQHDTELVYRGYFCRLAGMQGAGIKRTTAHPRASRTMQEKSMSAAEAQKDRSIFRIINKPKIAIKMINVRINVAKSESTPSRPIFAKIAVNETKRRMSSETLPVTSS